MSRSIVWMVGILAVIGVGYYFVVVKQEHNKNEATQQRVKRETARADAIVEWAKITKTISLSPTEQLSMVRMPDPALPDVRFLDNVCLIYRNTEYKSVQFVCPSAETRQALQE